MSDNNSLLSRPARRFRRFTAPYHHSDNYEQKQALFFRLSQELRDRIYELVLLRRNTISVQYSNTVPDSSPLALVCKRLRVEATATSHRINTFVIHFGDEFAWPPDNVVDSSLKNMHQYRKPLGYSGRKKDKRGGRPRREKRREERSAKKLGISRAGFVVRSDVLSHLYLIAILTPPEEPRAALQTNMHGRSWSLEAGRLTPMERLVAKKQHKQSPWH